MTQEELIITVMQEMTSFDMNQVGQELSAIEELLVRRRLFRKWTQDAEGADLFSEDLAEVEAELAEREGEREALLEKYNRYERRYNWLQKQLEIIRFQSRYKLDSTDDDDHAPFGIADDDEVPF